jgi:kynurenine formamidase
LRNGRKSASIGSSAIKGGFILIGLPLKWRGGTASPIRAVAVFEM